LNHDESNYFILVGDKETWSIAFLQNIWGFSERSKGKWNTSNVGDYVAFYAVSPLKRIIGYGRITSKFVSEDIVWPDEKLFGKSIWKYRIRFEKLRLLKDWKKGVRVPEHIMLNTGRKVVNKETFSNFLEQLI
jgi:ribosomal protein L39E